MVAGTLRFVLANRWQARCRLVAGTLRFLGSRTLTRRPTTGLPKPRRDRIVWPPIVPSNNTFKVLSVSKAGLRPTA